MAKNAKRLFDWVSKTMLGTTSENYLNNTGPDRHQDPLISDIIEQNHRQTKQHWLLCSCLSQDSVIIQMVWSFILTFQRVSGKTSGIWDPVVIQNLPADDLLRSCLFRFCFWWNQADDSEVIRWTNVQTHLLCAHSRPHSSLNSNKEWAAEWKELGATCSGSQSGSEENPAKGGFY